MKRIKLMGLALLALLALGAFASASAFAENPTINNAKGEVPTKAVPFTFKSETLKEEPLLEGTKGGVDRILCKSATSNGSFFTQDAGLVTVRFSGCKNVSFGADCQSNGVAGVIETSGPIQLIDILPTSTLDLGIWIEPKDVTGTKDLTWECGVLKVTILGSLIGAVNNKANTLLTPSEGEAGLTELLVLWKQKAGEQEVTTCMLLLALCKNGSVFFSLLADFGKGHELAGLLAHARVFGFNPTPVKILF